MRPSRVLRASSNSERPPTVEERLSALEAGQAQASQERQIIRDELQEGLDVASRERRKLQEGLDVASRERQKLQEGLDIASRERQELREGLDVASRERASIAKNVAILIYGVEQLKEVGSESRARYMEERAAGFLKRRFRRDCRAAAPELAMGRFNELWSDRNKKDDENEISWREVQDDLRNMGFPELKTEQWALLQDTDFLFTGSFRQDGEQCPFLLIAEVTANIDNNDVRGNKVREKTELASAGDMRVLPCLFTAGPSVISRSSEANGTLHFQRSASQWELLSSASAPDLAAALRRHLL